MTFESKAMKCTRCDVEVRVGSAEDENQDASVEETWEDIDAGELDSSDELCESQ